MNWNTIRFTMKTIRGTWLRNSPWYDQGAKDTPCSAQHDERTDHRGHDSDGHALAWPGSGRHFLVAIGITLNLKSPVQKRSSLQQMQRLNEVAIIRRTATD